MNLMTASLRWQVFDSVYRLRGFYVMKFRERADDRAILIPVSALNKEAWGFFPLKVQEAGEVVR